MTLSRVHLGILGVVSIFTGIISPVVSNNIASYPFPLTELQFSSYLILISLALICILITVRSWLLARALFLFVLGIIGYLFIVTWNGEVRTTSGILATSLSWGLNHITVYDYPSLEQRCRVQMPDIQEFSPYASKYADPRLGFHHSYLISPKTNVHFGWF